MLKAKYFQHCVISPYLDTAYHTMTSEQLIQHLDRQVIDGVDSIMTHAVLNLDAKPRIIVNYFHIDKITARGPEPTPHHMGSFKRAESAGPDWGIRCEHSIQVIYPEICILRKLHNAGNHTVRKGIIEFIKSNKYIDIKDIDFDDATWLMANILGRAE